MSEMVEVLRLAARDAERAEAAGSLTPDVTAAIKKSGILRHFVPARWGGTQGSFSLYLQKVAELGEADASSAWCAAIMASASRMAAFLPEAGQQAVWAESPDVFLCATLHAGGLATPTPDGWLVEGTWSYVSGVRFANWALLCCRVPDGHAQFMLVPRRVFVVKETWDAAGMRGTGSESLTIAPTLVPASHAFSLRSLFTGNGDPSAPCFAVPHEAVSGIAFVAPLIGASRSALRIWCEQLRLDTSTSAATPIAAQVAIASASAKTDAAQLLVERAARAADQHCVSPVFTGRNRRDYAMAASLVSQAVADVFQAAGLRASSHGGQLQRIWRDVGSAALHPALQTEPAAANYFVSITTGAQRPR